MKARLLHYLTMALWLTIFALGFWASAHYGPARDVGPTVPGTGFVAR